jgi:hypothetical protein
MKVNSAPDCNGTTVEVGDTVGFKEDVEGRGVLLQIDQGKNWIGDTSYSFLVGMGSDGHGRHSASEYDHYLNQYVVFTYRVYLLEKKESK